jgi:hypothetical protein
MFYLAGMQQRQNSAAKMLTIGTQKSDRVTEIVNSNSHFEEEYNF